MPFLIFIFLTICSFASSPQLLRPSPIMRQGFFGLIHETLKNIYDRGHTQSLSQATSETTPIPAIKHDITKRKVLKIPYRKDEEEIIQRNDHGLPQLFFECTIPLAPLVPISALKQSTKMSQNLTENVAGIAKQIQKNRNPSIPTKAPPAPYRPPILLPPPMPQKTEQLMALHQKMFIPPPPPKDVILEKSEKSYKAKTTPPIIEHLIHKENDHSFKKINDQGTSDVKKKEDTASLYPENKKTTFQLEDDEIEILSSLKDVKFFSLKLFYQMFARYVVIDTEATGLGQGQKITEIGCVVIEGMQITGEQFHSLINPQRHVSPSAHKLTGYTLSFLSDFPTFDQIAPFFEKFVSDSPIVLHNAHFDLKLIREGFMASKVERDFEKTNPIFDTLTLARKNAALHKIERKNNLTLLCEHFKIKTTDRVKHGARIDALLTAQVFLKLFWEDPENFVKHTNWDNLPRFNVFDKFTTLNKTNGRTLFEKFGVKSPLPNQFLYAQRLYHPQLNDHFPATIIPFYKREDDLFGFFVRYHIRAPILESHQNYNNNIVLKNFYGHASSSYATLFSAGDKVLFVGSIIHGLLVRDALQDPSLLEALNIGKEDHTIRGVLTTQCFKTLEIYPSTRQIFLLIDHFDKEKESMRQTLTSVIERFCHKQFFSFYNVILNEQNLIDWQVKYMQENWIVTKDFIEDGKRFIEIRSELYKKFMIVFDNSQKKVFVEEKEINDPNTELLFSDPKITIRCVTLKTKETKLSLAYFMADVMVKKTEESLKRSLELKNLKDLIFIGKIEQALRMYNESLTITDNSPVKKYCTARGILFPLPTDFRYREEDYHPWLEKNYPVLIVPLYNQRNKIVGIHRIFFHQSGEPLPKRSLDGEKIPTKLSLGKTVASANELYKESVLKYKTPTDNDHAQVVMLSEGFENGLIVRDALDYLAKNDPAYAAKIHAHFGINDTFSIKGCVGINGLIDVPLYDETKTVILLADNDGNNDAAKATIKQTIEKFLSLNKQVYLVFPEGNRGEKLDINDVFLRTKKNPFHEIGHMLLRSIQVVDAKSLAENNESLQDIFLRLKGEFEKQKNAEHEKFTPYQNCDSIRFEDVILETTQEESFNQIHLEKPFQDFEIDLSEKNYSQKEDLHTVMPQPLFYDPQRLNDLIVDISCRAESLEKKRYKKQNLWGPLSKRK
jgi:DNA polymerase-3 subunit epsilon